VKFIDYMHNFNIQYYNIIINLVRSYDIRRNAGENRSITNYDSFDHQNAKLGDKERNRSQKRSYDRKQCEFVAVFLTGHRQVPRVKRRRS